MIYLDNAATTRPSLRVLEAYNRAQTDFWANPSSIHKFGEEVFFELKKSRQRIKDILGVKKGEIYFTSGASEGINIFLNTALKRAKHIVASPYEHSAVYENLKYYEENGGKIDYLALNEAIITEEEVQKKVKPDTDLLVFMHVNNEIGAINDVESLVKIARSINPKIKIFVDGVQAVGKIKVDLNRLGVNGYSISPHKFHGIKGSGLLYVNDINLSPIILGGGQEFGMRSGTENVGAILSTVPALEDATANLEDNRNKYQNLREAFINGISSLPDYKINKASHNVPNILNISFKGIRGEVLVHALENDEIYLNTSSACASHSKNKSRTLEALDISPEYIDGTIRVSFSDENELDDIKSASERLVEIVNMLRRIMG